MEPEELRKAWAAYTEKNDFILNPDKVHVDFIVKGVLTNEEKYGLKLCPCRLRDESRERDLELICPCNFKTHKTWLDPMSGREAMCWCGLFVRRT